MRRIHIAALLGALCSVVACSDRKSPNQVTSATDHFVRLVAPAAGSVVNGTVDVALEVELPEPAVAARFGVEGEEPFDLPGAPQIFRLDTTQFDDGEQTLRVEVDGESGQTWADTLRLIFDNPDYSLLRVVPNQRAYVNGDQVVLSLHYSEAGLSIGADFSNIDSNFSNAGLSAKDLGAGDYELWYRISSDNRASVGGHDIRIVARNGEGEELTNPVRLALDGAPTMPISIDGAPFVPGEPPHYVVANANQNVPLAINAPATLISGEQNTITVDWDAAAATEANRVVVSVEGNWGYYVLPVAGTQATAHMRMAWPADGVVDGAANLLIYLLDVAGKLLGTTKVPVTTVALDPSAVSVSLTWDSAADLDLTVNEPDGSVVDYQHVASISGGKLDLDANAMCAKSPVVAEHVSWKLNSEPRGNYTPKVTMYDGCGAAATNYALTIRACGRQLTVQRAFAASDSGAAASHVLEPFIVDCLAVGHSGRVRFEKSLKPRMLAPAAFVPVRAVTGTGTNRTVLTNATTDVNGYYDFNFANDPGAYRLEVEATWTPNGEAAPRLSVLDVVTARSHVVTPSGGLTAAAGGTTEAVITVEDNAGALNILDAGRRVMQWVQANWGALPKPLLMRWTRKMNDSYLGTRYVNSNVMIAGADANPDEFDDGVIGHEVVHYLAGTLSRDDTNGGDHDVDYCIQPAFAWSEGLATGLAQRAIDTSQVLDSLSDGRVVLISDIESNPIPKGFESRARGTLDGKMTGAMNELLPAMILWDLLDPANEPHDAVAATDIATADSLFRFIPMAGRPNRGANGADLVDFLDGWRIVMGETATADSGLCGILKERNFNFQFPDGRFCP